VGQLLPHSEVIVVTTPQPSAADVAIRSALVARQTGQSVLGVVETMSAGALPDGTTIDLFGSGGGQQVAESLGVPLLGQIPLSVRLRETGDEGQPVVWSEPDDSAARALAQTFAALQATRKSLVGSSLPLSTR
jgi:ATP-binding protein involved in chromosome partitioning